MKNYKRAPILLSNKFSKKDLLLILLICLALLLLYFLTPRKADAANNGTLQNGFNFIESIKVAWNINA
jgi:hypothetical protein